MSVPVARLFACRDIDDAAGQARLRYITDVPGQQATYLVKLQQSQEYLVALALDAEATVPPYVGAEAAAMGSGTTAADAANAIIATAASWNDVIGPSIEQARRAGKLAVEAAQSEADVETERVAALAALGAL